MLGWQGIKESSLVDEKLEKVDKLKEVAKKLDASVAQLALAWCAHNTDVSTVIMGATSEKRVWPVRESCPWCSVPLPYDLAV